MLTTMGAGDELFHTATGTAFTIIDGHRETWPIRSKRFRLTTRSGASNCARASSGPDPVPIAFLASSGMSTLSSALATQRAIC